MNTQHFVDSLPLALSSHELAEVIDYCYNRFPQIVFLEGDKIFAKNTEEERVVLASRTGAWWQAEEGRAFGVVDRLLSDIRSEMKTAGIYFENYGRDEIVAQCLHKVLTIRDDIRSNRN